MEEMAFAGAPQEHHRRAIQQVGPSIMMFGSEEQKQRYLPGIASAEIAFAMGLSEPDAGSDLANVQTRAVRDGDDFLISGHKRFTSGAHFSSHLWTVSRTDPDAPKHRGISMMVVPLDAPGVDVRPLIDLQDRHHFNDVFLDEVRVPAGNLIGEENRGWYVNAATMDFERSGIARIANLRRLLQRSLEAIRASTNPSPRVVQQLSEIAVAVEVSRLLAYRVAWLQDRGDVPNYEVSITKLLASETSQRLSNLMVNAHGLAGLLTENGASGDGSEPPGPGYLAAIPDTIAQGSSEIQRNVIATRGLGLPRQ